MAISLTQIRLTADGGRERELNGYCIRVIERTRPDRPAGRIDCRHVRPKREAMRNRPDGRRGCLDMTVAQRPPRPAAAVRLADDRERQDHFTVGDGLLTTPHT